MKMHYISIVSFIILTLIIFSSCNKNEGGFATGTKDIDFVVVNGSNEQILIRIPPSTANIFLQPNEKYEGSITNADWIRVEVYIYRTSEWQKVTDHKFTKSGTWYYH